MGLRAVNLYLEVITDLLGINFKDVVHRITNPFVLRRPLTRKF
jgi:hypothetical protein